MSLSFLTLFVTFGFVVAVIIPPFQAPDENAHWIAAYQRSQLLEQNRGCSIANRLDQVFETARIAFQRHQKISGKNYRDLKEAKEACASGFVSYGSLATYPGVVLARLITNNEDVKPDKAFQVFLLSRIFQGLMIAGVAFRLVWLLAKSGTPVIGIATTTAMLLAPLTLQQSFAVSADPITFALALYLIALIAARGALKRSDWIALHVLAIAVCLSKPPLFPLILLAVGYHLFKYPANRAWGISLACISLAAGVWMTCQDHTPPQHQMMGRDISLSRQIEHVISHPIQTCRVLFSALRAQIGSQSLVSSLGWLDTSPSSTTERRYFFVFFVALLTDSLLCLVTLASRKNKLPCLIIGDLSLLQPSCRDSSALCAWYRSHSTYPSRPFMPH